MRGSAALRTILVIVAATAACSPPTASAPTGAGSNSTSTTATGTGGAGGAAGASTAGSLGGTGGVGPLPWSARFPTIVNALGPTLQAPSVQPVFFADEDAAEMALLLDFLSALAGSAYWAATTQEYGVGPLTVVAPVDLAEMAPAAIDYDGIEAWLTEAIATSAVPAPTPGVIYTLYFPSSTTITSAAGSVSCQAFGGYHGAVMIAGAPVAYVVVPSCAAYSAHLADGDVLQGSDFLTGLSSHELVEAATDPAPLSAPAFSNIDAVHLAWSLYLYGGEVGDTCEKQPGAFHLDPALGYTVQSTWSNAAAGAGLDPCVPSASPYLGAFPRLPEIEVLWADRQAVAVPLGGTLTVPVDLAGEAAGGGLWSVKALDFQSTMGGPANLELSLDEAAGKNGDVVMLTIHVLSFDGAGKAGFLLESQLGPRRTRVAGLVVEP